KLYNNLYFKLNDIYTIPPSVLKKDRVKYKFTPIDISKLDISSNDGLKNIVKNIVKDYFTDNNYYNIIIGDQNIYWRLCKKYYNYPKPLSRRPVVVLGNNKLLLNIIII